MKSYYSGRKEAGSSNCSSLFFAGGNSGGGGGSNPLSFEEGRSRLWTATVLINARGGRDEQEKKEEREREAPSPPPSSRPLKKEKREKVTMTAEKWRGVGFDTLIKGKCVILFKM